MSRESRVEGRKSEVATARVVGKTCPLRPKLALVLGSGFGSALERVVVAKEIPYAKLPGFPQPTVQGHSGKLVLGTLGGTPVVVLSGRAHYYEGHAMAEVTFAVRVLAEFGVRDLLLTNAAGGVNRRFRPGDFMRLTDHINLMGANPLRGPCPPGLPRFLDLSQVYDPALGALLDRAAKRARVRWHRGVYLALSGPTYETPAEIRAFARLGADAVGMSTVPEAIVARHLGLRVAAVSCISNQAAGLSAHPLSHDEVLATAKEASRHTGALLEEFARLYGRP
ncbi:MAG: purine-nucleoside phosphorylase [Limisphaerales bacterium]